MGPGEFDITINVVHRLVSVTVAGELDHATADHLDLIDGPHLGGETEVVVDLQALTFIDAAGLRALLRTRDQLSRQGSEVEFVNPPRVVTRITDLLGVDLNGELGA